MEGCVVSLGDVFSSLAKGVAAFAPTLATMLGGPMAGAAVTAIEGALGLKAGAGPQACLDAITNAKLTGDQIVAMQKANLEHEEKIKELQIDLAKINAAHQEAFAQDDVQDRASARGREMAVRDSTPRQLAWIVIGGFLTVSLAQLVGMVAFADQIAKIPPQGWLLIGNISGYLANEAKQAGSYYFGSSAGSQAKDATISKLADPTT